MAFSFVTFADEATNSSGEAVACTMEYRPVCGEVEVQCNQAPCPTVKETFGNMCVAKAAKATNITEWECSTDPFDLDDEEMAVVLLRAYDAGITKYDNLKDFMGTSYLTREQTAKMLMAAVTTMGVEEWMIKQPAWSCEWLDEGTVTKDLLDRVKQSCMKWLFKGGNNKYFMPQNLITHDEMKIVFDRLGTFIPHLEDIMDSLLTAHTSHFVTRNEFVTMLILMKYDFDDHEYAQHRDDLAAARALWAEKGQETYTLTQQMSCFCVPDYTRPITYKVSDGIVQSGTILYADDNSAVASGVMIDLHTVVWAFDLIEAALDQHASSLTVSYDEATGYPKSISIDYEAMIADEEKYYTFTIGTGS